MKESKRGCEKRSINESPISNLGSILFSRAVTVWSPPPGFYCHCERFSLMVVLPISSFGRTSASTRPRHEGAPGAPVLTGLSRQRGPRALSLSPVLPVPSGNYQERKRPQSLFRQLRKLLVQVPVMEVRIGERRCRGPQRPVQPWSPKVTLRETNIFKHLKIWQERAFSKRALKRAPPLKQM